MNNIEDFEKRTEIQADLKNAKMVFGPANPYLSGYYIGEALKIALKGDYSTKDQLMNLGLMDAITPKYVAELVAVFLGELAYLNRFDGVEDCLVASRDDVSAIKNVIHQIKDGDEFGAFSSGVAIAASLGADLKNCKTGGHQAVELGSWLIATAGSKQALVDAASANTKNHAQEIERHVQEVWDTFFKFNQPVKTGKALG